MLIALLAVFAVGAVASASASAKNPTWMVCKEVSAGAGKFEDSQCTKSGKGNWEAKELLAGESREIQSEANGPQLLRFSSVTIECKKFKTEAGAKIIGGEPGTDEEVIVYEECHMVGFPMCKINKNGTIGTNTLASKLVFLTKKGAETESPEETGTLLKPKSGTTLFTVTFEHEPGGNCPFGESMEGKALPVTGEVVAENVKGGVHAKRQELSFPVSPIKTYWVQVAKTVTEERVKKAEMALVPLGFIGRTFYKLTSGEAFWIF
jgi:hypothetical protein